MLEINFSIYNLLSVLTCFVGFLYAFQITTFKKNKTKDTKFFTWFLVCLSFIVLFFFLVDLNIKFRSITIVVLLLVVPLSLVLGPLMWLYIRQLISCENGKRPIIHFIPALVVGALVSILSITVVVLPKEDQALKKIIIDILTIIALGSLVVVFLIQNAIYIFLSVKGYRQHRRKMEQIYSYSEEVDLSWLKILVFGYVFFIVGMVLVNVIKGDDVSRAQNISSYKKGIKIETNSVNDLRTGDKVLLTGYKKADKDVRYKIVRLDTKTFYVPDLAFVPNTISFKEVVIKSPDKKISAITNIFFNLIILLYIIYSGHHAMKQKTLLFLDTDINEPNSNDEKDKIPSESHRVIFEKIKEELLEVIENEKPYLDQNLNIFTLAKRLNTNSKYLSQVINHEFDKSFVHFINEYRVEEAKKVLLSNNNYTIEAQSQMVGFKSKSAFNSAFKRHTGKTPSVFIQGNRG